MKEDGHVLSAAGSILKVIKITMYPLTDITNRRIIAQWFTDQILVVLSSTYILFAAGFKQHD